MPNQPENSSTDSIREPLLSMTFWDHVDALRSILLRIAVVIVVITGGLFAVMPWIFDNIILAPCNADFPLYRLFTHMTAWGSVMPDFSNENFHVNLINIKLASQFFIHMSSSFWLAVVIAFPIIIYLLWGFIAPGLYQREKKGFTKAFIAGCGMFYVGVSIGYFIVFPLTLRFLAQYKVSEMVPNQISLDSYMDNFLVLILVMGLIFELPLLAWILGKMGLMTRNIFKKYRRYAIAGLLVLAAVITPTGDPFTLMVVFLPIYGLWELSAWLVPPSREDDDNDKEEPDKSNTSFDDLYIPTYQSKKGS